VISSVLLSIDKFADWLAQDRWRRGAGLVRIGFGAIVALTFVVCWRQRALYFFSDGIASLDNFRSDVQPDWGFNLFAFPLPRWGEELMYVAGFAVATLFALGLFTRVSAILFAVVAWSLVHRCPGIIDGGYRLLCISAIYMCFMSLDAYSLDARLFGRRPHIALLTMLHNAAAITFIVQLCIVYEFSAFYKLHGESWQQGTAIYYVLTSPEFDISPFTKWLASQPTLIGAATYATMLFQGAFPWLIVNHRTKYAVLLVATAFHLGIAFSMGLHWFSAIMITAELLVLTDGDYREIVKKTSAPAPLARFPQKGLVT
jgi:hypothetical protein